MSPQKNVTTENAESAKRKVRVLRKSVVLFLSVPSVVRMLFCEGGFMKRRVKLTFPQQLIKEPVIFSMAKRFDVMPNIRRARITETVGEMVLELEGTEENLEKGIQALRDQGVDVELVEGDIVE
jgi:ABC-type methionine transport system ATPase subunit